MNCSRVLTNSLELIGYSVFQSSKRKFLRVKKGFLNVSMYVPFLKEYN